MANPHHRKKHREQVKHFRETHQGSAGTTVHKAGRSSSSLFLAIFGAVAGALIAIFAAKSSPLWLAILIISGFSGGYYIGRSLENDTKS